MMYLATAKIHSTVYDLDVDVGVFVRLHDSKVIPSSEVYRIRNWYHWKYRRPVSTEYLITNLEKLQRQMIPWWLRIFEFLSSPVAGVSQDHSV